HTESHQAENQADLKGAPQRIDGHDENASSNATARTMAPGAKTDRAGTGNTTAADRRHLPSAGDPVFVSTTRPGQEVVSLLDNLGGRLDELFGQRNTLLLGCARIDEQLEIVAGLEGDGARLLTLENARDQATGLFTEVAVVDAHRSDCPAHHAVGV